MEMNTAILLAGGKSRRMGFDKRFIEIENKTMVDFQIERLYKAFQRILLITDDRRLFSGCSCEVIEDEFKDIGVLGGLYTGLKNSYTIYNYVLACDMPSINYNYIEYMKELLREAPKEYDGLVTRYGEWIEPFNAFYHKNLIHPLKDAIEDGHKRISFVLKKCDVLYVDERTARSFSPDWRMFTNLNSEDDLKKYLQKKD
ncbi:molybdopterin-guanine dinucleotide biosynthesis protein A [Anaerosolibacter carboniphilus]|uniref:Probable molybdenum cofactor guanylyltransferase n=2 Tax=Anaerosolibacter carboniphilus TaxID=1417629 RepID=A0A841L089_9FIRM|nr:molybdopterin-guanine dinucleotide biosynthesis protein A [Anaerosolibacter carboniphilus]